MTGRPSSFTQEKADEICDVYGLYDPRDGALRYIGKANCAAKRLKRHIIDSRRRDTPVYRWMRKLEAAHMVPVMKIIERGVDWREIEIRHIAEARQRGERLLNVADGGNEPHCPHSVRVANGKLTGERKTTDPEAYWLWSVKRRLGAALKEGCLMNKTRAVMRECAELRPEIFGSWKHIPDRIEA